MNRLCYCIPVFVLALWGLACGSGGLAGGGIDGTGDVSIAGTASFPTNLSKARRSSGSAGTLTVENIRTGEKADLVLDVNGGFSTKIKKGDYLLSAVSPEGSVLQLVLADLKQNSNSANLNVNSSAATAYTFTLVNSSLSELSTLNLVERLTIADDLQLNGARYLSDSKIARSLRTASFTYLSVLEIIEAFAENASLNGRTEADEVKSQLNQNIENGTYIASAIEKAIEKVGKGLYVPMHQGELYIDSKDDFENMKSWFLQNVANETAFIEGHANGTGSAPKASAGSDITVGTSQSLTLNGSKSFDPDTETLFYSWTQISGSKVTLSDKSSATPSFVTPSSDEALVFELKVNDGQNTSAGDRVEVQVTSSHTNQQPILNTDVVPVDGTSLIKVDATSTLDQDQDALSFSWTRVSGVHQIDLVNTNSPIAYILTNVNTQSGLLTLKLEVSDGKSTVQTNVNINITP